MKSVLRFSFAFSMGFAVCAEAVEFPSNGGDLASAESWGGTVPSGEAVSLPKSGTYTASANVAFGVMDVSAPQITFALAGSETSAGNVSCASFSLESKNMDVSFSSGNFAASGDFSLGSTNATIDAKYNTLTLKNGASIEVGGKAYISNKKKRNTLKVTEKSSMEITDNLIMGVNANGENRIEITSGGRLSVKGDFHDGSFSSAKNKVLASTANSVVIQGEGSKLSVEGALFAGAVYADNSVTVSDGAVLENGYRIFVGSATTVTNTVMEICNGSTITGTMLAVGEGATGSVFRVTGDSQALFSGEIYLGGYNYGGVTNVLEVENSDFTCKDLIIGKQTASYASSFRLSGPRANLAITRSNVSRYPLFTAGSGHEFVLDGATWHHSDINLQFDTAAENCSLRLENGAVFVTDGGFYSGTNSAHSCGNTFYVGDGASFTGQFIRISRCDNSVVVSNGCCVLLSEADSRNTGLRIGDQLDNVSEIGGNSLILQGAAPKVRSAKEVRIANSSLLRFDIPAVGLSRDNVPVVCSKLVIDEESELLATGVYEHSRAIEKTVSYVLAEASAENMISVPKSVVDAANADLRNQGCRRSFFSVSADKRQLLLTVRPAFDGLKVVIR